MRGAETTRSELMLPTTAMRAMDNCFLLLSNRQQHAQVAQIIPCRTDHDAVAQSGEERAGIELSERLLGIKVVASGAGDRSSISDRTGGGAVAVDAIRPG